MGRERKRTSVAKLGKGKGKGKLEMEGAMMALDEARVCTAIACVFVSRRGLFVPHKLL